MIRAILNWIHRITAPPAPPVEVMVGDVWEEEDGSPWRQGWEVLDVRDGWVKYQRPGGNSYYESRVDSFREDRALRSRHKPQKPTPEIGDKWADEGTNPWHPQWTVEDVKEGYVKASSPTGSVNVTSLLRVPIERFVERRVLKSRATEEGKA